MPRLLLPVLAAFLAGCASPPPEPWPSVSDACKAAYAATPSFGPELIAARIAGARAAYPDDAAWQSRPKPAPLQSSAPQFPQCASLYGISSATCDIIFDVTAEGTTGNVAAVCTHALFEDAATRAARRWTFGPAMVDGAPAATPAVVRRIRFELHDIAGAPEPE